VCIVGATSNAADAIELGLRARPDVVLLDVFLDKSSGFEVLRSLKKCDPAPVFVVMTNYVEPYHRKKYVESGAEYFFDKVVEFDSVLQCIRQLRYRFPPASDTPAVNPHAAPF
jgi:DNA-binding NarL/FixJ family response regulator